MIDHGKWIETLPSGNKIESENYRYHAEPSKWTETIPKKNNKKTIKNFSLTLVLFVIGLVFVSIVKNKTRYLQKEINNLQASINLLESDLDKTTLDFQVITSPENISRLGEKHLENDFIYYKKSQIRRLNDFQKIEVIKNEQKTKKVAKLNNKIKIDISKKIQEKKTELKKLAEIYKKPNKLPKEIKIKVASKITSTKNELNKLYKDPKGSIDLQKIKQWGAVQIVKVFLGIPIVPGR